MSNSWGHKIASASPRERAHNGDGQPFTCVNPKCMGHIVFVTSYAYVTGRRGRTSRAERFVCEAHGRKFAEKHGLECPDPSVPGAGSIARGNREQFIAAATQAFTSKS